MTLGKKSGQTMAMVEVRAIQVCESKSWISTIRLIILWSLILIDSGPVSGCNMMQRIEGNRCICSGDRIVYECSISGPGSTVWSGTLFRCPVQRDEIILLHSRFGGVTKYCNTTNRSITVHSLDIENNCFTSRLYFSADSTMNSSTVSCIHDNEINLITIGSPTVIIDSFPSPSSLQLAKVNENELIFAWEPNNGSSSCPSLYYEPVSNCGECTVSLDYAICHTSSVTSDAKVCSFAVRTIICGNTVGTESETVNIILKVPEAPRIVSVKPEFFLNDTLKFISLTFAKVESFVISGDVDGSATNYTIVYLESISGIVCDSITISAADLSCVMDTCNQVEEVPLSCRATGGINVTVYATNMFGRGALSAPVHVSKGSYSFSKVTLCNYGLIISMLFISTMM